MDSYQRRQKWRERYRWHLGRIASETYGVDGVFWTPHHTYDRDHDIDFYFVDRECKTTYCAVMDSVMTAYAIAIEDEAYKLAEMKYPILDRLFDVGDDGVVKPRVDREFEDRYAYFTETTKTLMDSGNVTVRERIRLEDYGRRRFGCFVDVAVNWFNTDDVKKFVSRFLSNGVRVDYVGPTEYSFTSDQMASRVSDENYNVHYTGINVTGESFLLGR